MGIDVNAILTTGLLLLAEGEPANPLGGGLMTLLLPFLIIGFLFYFLLIRPQRREQNNRKSMLAAVKRNDRVVTIGGIYGVVAKVDAEADEVTIKVDETSNTKLRLTFSSIARVLTDDLSDKPAH